MVQVQPGLAAGTPLPSPPRPGPGGASGMWSLGRGAGSEDPRGGVAWAGPPQVCGDGSGRTLVPGRGDGTGTSVWHPRCRDGGADPAAGRTRASWGSAGAVPCPETALGNRARYLRRREALLHLRPVIEVFQATVFFGWASGGGFFCCFEEGGVYFQGMLQQSVLLCCDAGILSPI